MNRFGETEQNEISREAHLVAHVKCEIAQSLVLIEEETEEMAKAAPASLQGNPTTWLDGMGAQVTLTMQIDETGALAPTVMLNRIMRNAVTPFAAGGNVTTARSTAVTAGASISSHATRTETVSFYYTLKSLRAEQKLIDAEYMNSHPNINPGLVPCTYRAAGLTPELIDGNLKISDFMRAKVDLARSEGLLEPAAPGAPPYTTFQYQTQFVVASMGTLDPVWKLSTEVWDPTGTLISGGRTRTNTILLTLGPDDKGKPALVSANVHASGQAGPAIAAAIQGSMH